MGSICIPAVKRGLFRKAIAIEPDPSNFMLLTANILLNGLQEIVFPINSAAASQEDVPMVRTDGGSNSGDHRFFPANDNLSIRDEGFPSILLDSLVPQVKARGALLWMDIQCAEGFALLGAEKLLSLEIPVVLEFDATLLEPNGGLAPVLSSFSTWPGFFNLASSRPELLPVNELRSLYSVSKENHSSFDLLFVPTSFNR